MKRELIGDPHRPAQEFAKGGGGGGFKAREIEQIVNAQTQANRVNQNTPTGTVRYSGNTVTTRLSPEQQALLEQQQIGQLMAGETAAARLGQLGAGRDAVERATFDRGMSLLNPVLEQRERALTQRLANQGLPQTSGAYDREMGRYERGVNNQLEQLAMSAVMAGGQEESRLANMILGLLGAGTPAGIPMINVPQVTVPVNQPNSGGGNPALGFLAGGGAGAAAAAPLAATNPWALPIGAGIGGLLGLAAG
ncbi:MAG: hypothetical protein AB7O44_27395 [Hyphomicrobiaceae bacterium]